AIRTVDKSERISVPGGEQLADHFECVSCIRCAEEDPGDAREREGDGNLDRREDRTWKTSRLPERIAPLLGPEAERDVDAEEGAHEQEIPSCSVPDAGQ